MKPERPLDGVTLAIDAQRVGTLLRAPVPGRFLRRHPARAAAFVHPGQLVHAGATLALIALGPVLVPVTMPADGFVLALAAADRGAVGYGEALAEIVTLADLAAMGIAS